MAQTSKDKQPEEPIKRRARAEPVGRDVSLAARAAFAHAGFSDPTLIMRWGEIAGSDTARLAQPLRLTQGPSGGVLTLKSEPAAALFLQHESRQLCERINAFLGRTAVTKLRFVQGVLLRPALASKFGKPAEPPATDPSRSWRGSAPLGAALFKLAGSRNRAPSAD